MREQSRLGEGGGEGGAADEIMVELKSYEIAMLPSSGLRAGLSVARNDNLAAGGAAAFGDGPDDEGLAALHVTCDTHPFCR